MEKTKKMKSKEYAEYLEKRPIYSRIFRRLFFWSLAKEFYGRVLDIGCGAGGFLNAYENSVGIEINDHLIEYVKGIKGMKKRIFKGSIYSIPFKDNYFDGVLLSHVLEHLTDPKRALEEIKRVLKANGILLVVVPNKKGFDRDDTHVKFWKEKELICFLEENGFKVVKSYWFPVDIRKFKNLMWFNELRVKAIKIG